MSNQLTKLIKESMTKESTASFYSSKRNLWILDVDKRFGRRRLVGRVYVRPGWNRKHHFCWISNWPQICMGNVRLLIQGKFMGRLVTMVPIVFATEEIMAGCSTKIENLWKPALQCSFYDIWSKSLKTTFEGVHIQTWIIKNKLYHSFSFSFLRTSAERCFGRLSLNNCFWCY